MEQVLFGGCYDQLSTTTTYYTTLVGARWWSSVSLHSRTQVISTNGVIKKLRVKLSGSPGAGKKYVFTLMLNGAPTALTFEIADGATSGNNMVNEICVAAGDLVSLQCNPDGTPTARYAYWTSIFKGDKPKESLIMGTSAYNLGGTVYCQVMCSETDHRSEENDFRQVCPTAGTIKNLCVDLTEDPGDAPDAYRFTLRKNGVSTDLTVTITADATTGCNLTNAVDVVAGDILTLLNEGLNSPVASQAAWGMTFVADIDGESIVMGGSMNDLSDQITEYNDLISHEETWWVQTEDEQYQLGQTCTLKKLHILLSGSPGDGNSYSFTIRIAGANSNVVATVANVATTGNSGALEDNVANDEYVTLQSSAVSIPTVRDAYWGLVCYVPPAPTAVTTQYVVIFGE